jgi:fructose-1,6-bisphosphatase/inositol monophosphatase family enzyme
MRGVTVGGRLDADATFAREIAEAAGAVQRAHYEQALRVERKSAKDVVTEVDHLCEDLILGAIRHRFPGDGILAEESGAHHADLPGQVARPPVEAEHPPRRRRRPPPPDPAIARALASGRTWIVDPLDGTVNYANGIPFFCVSVALLVDGRPAVGVVHDPMRSETFWATAEGPARLGSTPIHASDKAEIGDLVVSLALGGSRVSTRIRALRKAIRVSRNMGSAALAFAYVANGRFDAFIQSGGMSAWDVAAAGLIAERAGAVVTDLAGGPWFEVGKADRSFGAVAAPSRHHAELLRLVA